MLKKEKKERKVSPSPRMLPGSSFCSNLIEKYNKLQYRPLLLPFCSPLVDIKCWLGQPHLLADTLRVGIECKYGVGVSKGINQCFLVEITLFKALVVSTFVDDGYLSLSVRNHSQGTKKDQHKHCASPLFLNCV